MNSRLGALGAQLADGDCPAQPGVEVLLRRDDGHPVRERGEIDAGVPFAARQEWPQVPLVIAEARPPLGIPGSEARGQDVVVIGDSRSGARSALLVVWLEDEAHVICSRTRAGSVRMPSSASAIMRAVVTCSLLNCARMPLVTRSKASL